MDDEVRIFAEHRPEAPPYPERARQALRARLLADRSPARAATPRWPRWLGPVAAVFAVTVVLVGGVAVRVGGPGDIRGAAVGGLEELDPRPGQLIMIESLVNTPSVPSAATPQPSAGIRYERVWQPVDGDHGVGLVETGVDGIPLPPPGRFAGTPCPPIEDGARVDYAYLRSLPAEPGAMRAWMERRAAGAPLGGLELPRLLEQTYMPFAQRKAAFEALKGLPGWEVEAEVRDALGRPGTALGRRVGGYLDQLVFDPESYLVLGRRVTATQTQHGRVAGMVTLLTARVRYQLMPGPSAMPSGLCLQPPAPTVRPTSHKPNWHTPLPSPVWSPVEPDLRPTGTTTVLVPTPSG
ncbi:hypothetical protein ACIBG7_07910 [Nonomuraea sp. NPDC050328]|uniref:hypothetical protein n=1 Tax=Nonomuraea sp. NPDC050328 TaxID=3364361 RepID=UPI0037994054